LRAEHEQLKGKAAQLEQDLAACRQQLAASERRHTEAASDVTASKGMLDGVTTNKCGCLKAFFEKHNMPGVVLALFRKIVELQGKLRCCTTSRPSTPVKSEQWFTDRLCFSSEKLLSMEERRQSQSSEKLLMCVDERRRVSSSEDIKVLSFEERTTAASSVSTLPGSLGHRCSSSGAFLGRRSPRSSFVDSTQDAVDGEVRQAICFHGNNLVSKHELQAYIDSIRLSHVPSPMVTQIILMLLGLDLGEGSCEVSRFVGLLTSPPTWEKLNFTTDLWGKRSTVPSHAIIAAAAAAGAENRESLSPRASVAKGRCATPRGSASPRGVGVVPKGTVAVS